MSMIRARLSAVVLSLAALLPVGARAASGGVDQVRAALSRNLPHFPPSARVLVTPYAGLYEVDVGTRVFYTDAAASVMITGDILDVKSGVNVTQARLQELQRIDWKDLPMKDSFEVVYGKGRRQVAVFEDPYCPYCHALEQSLAQVGDVTAHVFLLPVIRPESPAMARDIWCAPDRGLAWQEWMEHHKAPPHASASCKAPLDANLALGDRLGIQSTPTTFTVDGNRFSGALSADDLSQRLTRVK